MQGVIKIYDPNSQSGSLLSEPDLIEVQLGANALDHSLFRFLRPGQRVNFDLSETGQAINLRFGSEPDMKTPEQPPEKRSVR